MQYLLLALALVSGAASQSVKSCGGPNDHLKNPVFKVTPDPPVKGSSITIEASGTLDEVEASFNTNVDLKVHALGIIHASVTGGVPVSISPGVVKGPFSMTVGPFELPSNVPGKAVVQGQVQVTNAKNEPMMCIELDMSVGAMDNVETQVALEADVPSLSTVSSCAKATDHIPDLKIATSSGVITMSGTLDESVTKASIALDASVKVLFISVPLKMNIPLDISQGLFNKGAIKAIVGPTSIVVSPNVKATLKGTVKLNDGNSQEITCINLDTVVAGETLAANVLV